MKTKKYTWQIKLKFAGFSFIAKGFMYESFFNALIASLVQYGSQQLWRQCQVWMCQKKEVYYILNEIFKLTKLRFRNMKSLVCLANH